ncbi:aldehyde dehydrogenase family protein [Streptomyces roseus]|uniref:aldehyde dehydrogenase family protein n=1 Tax=Streptomyces roseus TaxID=66430 RepID=UPI003824F316
MNDAVQVPRAAFERGAWARASVSIRRAVLLRWADKLEGHAENLAILDALSTGKLAAETCDAHVPFAARVVRWFAECLDKNQGTVGTAGEDHLAWVTSQPLGAAAAVVPWNYSVGIAVWKMVPSLAAGNSLIVKPHENAPYSALAVARLAMPQVFPRSAECPPWGTGHRSGDWAPQQNRRAVVHWINIPTSRVCWLSRQMRHYEWQNQEGCPMKATGRLGRDFTGSAVEPQHPEYDAARRVFNGMIDRRPAMVARCRTISDVVAAVRSARELGWNITARGGGHSVAGFGTCDGGMVVDLSRMRSVRVNAALGVAEVDGGALWSDVDAITQRYDLAIPGGKVSTTGVAGLTLGGGHGYLSKAYGLTVDSLLAATVVTADGRVVETNPDLEPELWWAIRGGGGNFGVVTSFTFALHRVPRVVLSGHLIYEVNHAPVVWDAFVWAAEQAPRTVSLDFVALTAPDLPEIPERLRGRSAIAIAAFAFGDLSTGARILDQIRRVVSPEADLVRPKLYTEFQGSLDANHPAGLRNYWTSASRPTLNNSAAGALLDSVFPLPSRQSVALVMKWDGAISDVNSEDSAVPDRSPCWVIHPMAAWSDPSDDERGVDWARRVRAAVATDGEAYLNFTGERSRQQVAAYFGAPHLRRLRAAKSAWDPDNVFCFNHNITPL